MEKIKFKKLSEADLPAVKEIYDYYIQHSTATFHTEPISINELKEFIYVNHSRYKSYIIYRDNYLLGYCYLTHYKKRPAYDRTAEITLYLKPEFVHMGIGLTSVEHLENVAKSNGFHNLISVISGNNQDSLKLFKKAGYIKCGQLKNIGEKFGLVLDVLLYQKEI